MVRHANARMYHHLVAMSVCMGGGLQPCLLHCLAKRSEGKGGFAAESRVAAEIGHKRGEQPFTATHHKCDEIAAATVVVVASITWTIGQCVG